MTLKILADDALKVISC